MFEMIKHTATHLRPRDSRTNFDNFAMVQLFIPLALAMQASAAAVPSSAPGATLFEFTDSSMPWIVTNDPVMGGVSNSTFSVVDGLGVFAGEVKIVPYLHAPGTCQSEAAKFAPVDCNAFDAIEIRLESNGALKQFQASWSGSVATVEIPLTATENLLENTDWGARTPRQCSLGAAAC